MRSSIRLRCPCTYVVILAWFGLAGCSSSQQPVIRIHPERVDAAAVAERDPRQLEIFDGRSGESLNWEQMIARMDGADVIILGEQHDDGVAHATQLAIVQDVASRGAGSGARPGALSLEMLERDDQAVTDDYLEGIVDAEGFAKLTSSADWAGPGSWKKWYQPTIDAAAAAGWRVIAANSPRRYLRIARTDGYARLESLPRSRRALFDIPKTWPLDYRQRFIDVMAGTDDDEEDEETPAAPATTAPASQPSSQPASRPSPHGPMKPEDIDPGLRSQLLWDATMADSIAKARRSGAKPVIHLVGQFHSDFNGGTVQETRARLGRDARIITVSMQRRETVALRDRDRDRADFVIYTGRAAATTQ